MQLQGLRIEYFINGGISLIWLFPLLKITEITIGDLNNLSFAKVNFVIIIPLCYMIGMFISFFSALTFEIKRSKIRKLVFSSHFPNEHLNQRVILLKTANFNKEVHSILEINLTRQRVVKGNLINLILITIVSPLYLIIFNNLSSWFSLSLTIPMFFLWVINWKMWVRYQTIYYEYLCETYKYLKVDESNKN